MGTPRFSLELTVDNDAFVESMHHEVGRILREIADKVEGGPPSGSIFDANGNKVGEYGFTGPWDD